MLSIGVDGCRSGWFYIELLDSSYRFGVIRTLESIVERYPANTPVFVDIPIGLVDDGSGRRECDTAARCILGPRKSSVFSAPVRPVLAAADYEDAKARSISATGKALSKQSFAIVPKIREVDSLMQGSPKARTMVREVHPEVCFWALARENPMEYPKKTEEGFRERMKVLSRSWPRAEAVIAHAYLWSSSLRVGRDDVVDAMANAITASFESHALHTLPTQPVIDHEGLPMEMVYAVM